MPPASLPTARKVNGPVALREALMKHPEQFVRTMTEKLMTYALGRGLEYYDMPAVRSIERDAAGNNYRFSALILGIVKSTPFQMKKGAGGGRRDRRGTVKARDWQVGDLPHCLTRALSSRYVHPASKTSYQVQTDA